MLCNNFSLKHLLIATGNFWTYCTQNLAGLCLFRKVKVQDIPKKCGENFFEYFTHSINRMAKCVSTEKSFSTFLNSKIFWDKKLWCIINHRLVKIWDGAIIQISSKNKSILMFLINCNNCLTETCLRLSQHLRWRSFGN